MRVTEAMIAFGDLRIQTLGNHEGSDDLILRDLPELLIENGEAIFDKIPTMIVVRPELSKAKHRYFTFLSSEGCTYLKEYLEARIRSGEQLSYDTFSEVLHSKN